MTSRTSMGAQSQAHQRSLSGSVAPASTQQRSSPQQRGIQQSFAPVSPLRREASSTEQLADSPEGTQPRNATPIRAGSRLRQELYNESLSGTPSAPGTPPSLTPSRVTTAVASAEPSVASPTPSNNSFIDPENPPLPMPSRRHHLVYDVPSSKPPPAPVPQVKRDGRPKQYSIETPSEAPRYQKPNKPDSVYRDPFGRGLFAGSADFFPWNGSHHEDEWSMEAIQKGTWDRGSQNEVSSARLAVMPSLKQKTGLNALSTIFMGVINQRRNSGYLTAPSTFKPPPRVTLTDSKREIWLKDLANPAIPLRRLSRTIPHGIRGRTLLDQCLNKQVPTERAVWLAKCVGANEIRSFKRKGAGGNGAFAMGGEVKWIREWTLFVEQHVESVVSAFTEPDWKQRVTYAIRLATVLYSEHLLDRDHYLDWIIAGLEGSSQSRIPMWILIAQICWTDLLHCRKYGRRLVFALLNHLDAIHKDPDSDILIQLSSQLAGLLSTLVKHNPESFVYPTLWAKYQGTLQSVLPMNEQATADAFNRINARNANLQASNSASTSTGSRYLISLLDSTLQGARGADLASKCWASQENKSQIIKATVNWATSSHRPGLGRVYTAAAMIREWSAFRVDSTAAILETLDAVPVEDATRKAMVYKLVAELVRSGHFSVSQYIQWLIARGSCHDASEIDQQTGHCSSRLLVELPVYCLSEERRRDRANLLRRAASFNVNDEAQDVENAKQVLMQTLQLVPEADDSQTTRKTIPLRKLISLIRNSSTNLQSALGAHLREVIATQPPSKLNSDLTLSSFASMRTVFESIGDFTMLADVLSACARMSNIAVLSSCVDTIQVNLHVFFAMNRAEDLFTVFHERLKMVGREHGLIARPLLSTLASLALRLPNNESVAANLQQELLQSDKTNAIDACSPVSDNMVNQSQGVEGEVSEQIDKLLASGSSVDHPTMNRLFRNIIPRLEAGWAKDDETKRSFASLLGRLRVFDVKYFDKLMADWVSHIRTLKNRKALADLYPLMISLGCLPVTSILSTAIASPIGTIDAGAELPGSAVYLQELLQVMLMKPPKSTPLNEEEVYRFGIYQQAAKYDNPKALLSLMRNAIAEYSALKDQQANCTSALDEQSLQDSFLDTLRFLVVVDSAAVADALKVKELTTEAASLVRKIVVKLLIPGGPDAAGTSFDQILGLADELTMPFCQLTLNLELSLGQAQVASGDTNEHEASQFDVFAHAMDKAIEARNIMWTSMLPCLSDDITQHLKSQAHATFLDLMPSLKIDNLSEAALGEERIQLAKNLLGVIEAIVSGQPASKTGQITIALADKLTDLWELLTTKDERVSPDVFNAVVDHWLPTLLKFISLHGNAAEIVNAPTPAAAAAGISKPSATANYEPKARVILTLCGILLELEAKSLETTAPLEQHLFDVAMVLADGLPDDLRLQCAKSIIATPTPTPSKTTTSDARVYYLLSVLPSTWADNLVLAHRDKTSLPHSAAARGLGAMYGIGPTTQEKYSPFVLRRWEVLSEPTPNVGENDTSLSMALFETIKIE